MPEKRYFFGHFDPEALKVILNKKPILGILTRPGQFKFLIAG
jgi:hypothetical protein